jgi:hypothetical protein
MFGDENYVNKFGALKRGLVLMSYGRYNDAHQVLAKSVYIVKQQKNTRSREIRPTQRALVIQIGARGRIRAP